MIFSQQCEEFQTRSDVYETCRKIRKHFSEHEKILISVSGGSDSDCIVHLVCKYFPEHLHKCHFVFVDTGLEYAATKRHLSDLETKYGITIEKIRGKSVVWAVRKYGVPILSKSKSAAIDYFRRGVPCGERLVNVNANDSKFGFTENQRRLAHYIRDNDIAISKKCCDVSKKQPLMKYLKENGIDLDVTGERKAEGGMRSGKHKSCFETHKDGLDKFMPLWWWSDETKADFKRTEGIRYSDCYEVYGMKRTGCCGCPFSLNIAEELRIMCQYEPELYNACMKVFGLAYELTDRFGCRRKKCLPEEIQLSLITEIGGDEK
jgi:3'-phosphoadenosine 5'-phosphosulfate sulfotransferase (PAPS reductase)/FAD synthetase